MEKMKEIGSAIFASSQTKGLPNLPPLPANSSQSELYKVSCVHFTANCFSILKVFLGYEFHGASIVK